MAIEEYTFLIQRNIRHRDGEVESYWQRFKVEAEETMTVLTALNDIRDHQDGSITFRQSCRSAICGSCAMKIGGRTRLACKTHVSAVAEKDPEFGDRVIRLAPMANQPVLKDLAIDIDPFFNRVMQITPWLEEGAEATKEVTKSSFDQVNHVTQCIMCGCCYSDCTVAEVNENFLGPAALAKAFRFVSDPREGNKTARLKNLSGDHKMWSCSRCAMCVEVCPKDVAPMEAIVKLRTRGMEKGYTNNPGARHALAFHKDICKYGALNEFTILQRSVGVVGAILELGTAIHMLKKGKLPPIMPHKCEGLDQVRKMYDHLEQNPVDVETKAKEVKPE